MSIWNKILAWLVGVTALAFFYLAARTLETHAYWMKTAQSFQSAIKKLDKENETFLEGDSKAGQVGIRQASIELDTVLLERRRVWTNCEAKPRVGAADVNVTIDKPDPPGIAENTVLYAFEETPVDKRGRYLGEFKVTKAVGKDVTLTPTSILNARELDRLAVATKPWILYEVMPSDSRVAFAGLTNRRKPCCPPTRCRSISKTASPPTKTIRRSTLPTASMFRPPSRLPGSLRQRRGEPNR